MKTIKANCSPKQKAILIEFIDYGVERPSFDEYEMFQSRMKLLDKTFLGKKPTPTSIPNTTPGYEINEVKLHPQFDALQDLPLGWCVYPMYDSGGNHSIKSAGQTCLTDLWNYFWSQPEATQKFIRAKYAT